MSGPRYISRWIWSPILITVLAILSSVWDWPVTATVPVLVSILIAGLVALFTESRQRGIELSLLRLRQLAGYFNRRFMGDSSLSIFVIIDTLFNVDNPKLWEWARACDMSKRVFNPWCHSFIDRVESDIRSGRPEAYLYLYLNELWLVNNHYYEFIEQFYEIAEKVEIPLETRDQYHRFVVEYNAFAQEFRDAISQLKRYTRTEIEPPSVRLAQELSATGSAAIS